MAQANGITLTYLNIRQSISILIAKLFLLDALAAALTILFYFVLVQGERFTVFNLSAGPLFIVVFIILGIVKVLIDWYVILLWLNEYYEITPEHIVHKSGIIFKKKEQYRIDNIRAMRVEDSFLGEIFNFATITVYDIRLQKYLDMYLIHDPGRYAKVLKQLRPAIESKEDKIVLPFVGKEEGGEEE